MILWNYSSLRQREKKLYSVAGTQISSTGMSVTFLKIVAPCAGITLLLGIIICIIIGKNLLNPFGENFNMKYTVFSLGSGISIGLALWYIKIQTYRLYEYLFAYLKPKKTYHNLNERNKEYALHKVKTEGIIQSDL